MAIILHDLRLPLDADEREVFALAACRLRVHPQDIKASYLVRTSVDARHRNNIQLVYSVGLELYSDEQQAVARALPDAPPSLVSLRKHTEYVVEPGGSPLEFENRPVIAGFGPAGMFAGLLLSRMGYRPLIIERGADVDSRVEAVSRFWQQGVLSPDTNVQFGEGGAGTFSDGKLTTRINDPRCEKVLEEFVKHGAPAEIAQVAKPHIGTDKLREVVKSIRNEIIACGGEVCFNTKLEKITVEDGALLDITLGSGEELRPAALILAVGHSARDTFEMLHSGEVGMIPKPFSVGVRIEHLQSEIDRGLYGALAGHPRLPKGEYQLSLRQNGRAVYTFCMCPGGTVVAASSEEGGVVTNGMSVFARDGANANSALVVSVDPADYGGGPLDGIAFQRRLEQAAFRAGGSNYQAPCQAVGSFLGAGGRANLTPTYPNGVVEADLRKLLPDFVPPMFELGLRAFERKLPGFASAGAVMTGVETRTSSPVRIPRDEGFEALSVRGLYPAGEGAGYAGGIVSAAVDGLKSAEAVIGRYAPLR